MPENTNIEVRSDEVQEIMSKVPNWMIRWGITLIFVIVLLFLFLSWLIKYPDVVQGKATFSTQKPAIRLVAKANGEIDYISVKNNSAVSKGSIIATVGNNGSPTGKNYLIAVCQGIEKDLENFEFPPISDSAELGNIHQNYVNLKNAVLEYQLFLKTDPTPFEIANIQEQIHNQTILRSVNYQQLNTAKKQLKRMTEKFETDQELYQKGIISKIKLQEGETQMIQAENNVGNLKKSSIQNSIAITDLKKQRQQRLFEVEKQKSTLKHAIQLQKETIENSIEQWGKEFQIIAPIKGKLTYLENVSNHQFVEAGKELFAVVPENQDYIGYLKVPKSGYGKVKKGQRVRVQLDKYPHYEFGQLDGKVTAISLLPNKEEYQITFKLTNGLISSYGKQFEYTPEMTGTADVITEDVRLIQRVFNKFKKVFDQ